MKNSNTIIHTVYSSIQAGIKAVFKLKHTPIRHNIMTRDATIPFLQNRSNTANSEDRPILIQYDTSAVFFLMLLRISILLCVDPIVTLLCVKHNLLQCFSTGRSKVLGMQPKSGLRDRSERVADCLQPKKRHQQKT